MDERGEIMVYQSEDGLTRVDVKFDGDTVWLTQQQMADLFQSSRSNVVEHIRHIYEEGELAESSTCRKFRQVRTEGGRQVAREMPYYNLDMIISLGYRVKSAIATRFRQWATARLKEFMRKGFALDDERLKGNGGDSCWKGRGQSRMTPQWKKPMPNTASFSKRRSRQSKRHIWTVSRPWQRQSRAKRGMEMPDDENKIILYAAVVK